MKCMHFTKIGGFLNRVSQYIHTPGNVSYGQFNDMARAITCIYFSYC